MKKLWNRGRYCLSLLMASALSFTACTDDSDIIQDGADNKLQVNFAVNSHGSRAINRETSLPDGSQVGARLSGYTGYENLVYTASTGKTPQSWTGNKDVVLSDVSGTLYAFYPYDDDIDITAIPVDMTAADQTDWLYGVPATGITDLNPEVDVTMNHALANINLSIVGDNYAGDGNISSISVQSDGIASKGTFNAAQATPGYTAFTVRGEALERSVETTLGATATDIMVIPTGTEAAITFFVTVDDVVYSVKSAPLTLEMGNSYQYTLKLKSTYMSVDGVSVTPWNNVPKEDNLELEKYRPSVIKVYAVSATNELIDYTTADATCKGVAIHATGKDFEQKFMIAKKDATNDGSSYNLYWNYDFSDLSVINYSNADGTNDYGYLPKSNGLSQSTPHLSNDFTTWTDGVLSDFSGKTNTAVLAASSSNAKDMCKVLETFNTGTNSQSNEGYNDWYVPACGQLAIMYLAKTNINATLAKIGGTDLRDTRYWSSSECITNIAWALSFADGGVGSYGKNSDSLVRFVRDIE